MVPWGQPWQSEVMHPTVILIFTILGRMAYGEMGALLIHTLPGIPYLAQATRDKFLRAL
jgi:hypothetical protein